MGTLRKDHDGHEGSVSGMTIASHLGLDQFSYTAYEQWVKKEIKVRECCVFIKKTDGELEPMCHCGNVRSAHPEGIQIQSETEKWDKATHTTLTECTAYGKINFLDEDTTLQPEYIRVASDYGDRKNIQRMEKLLREFWSLNQPGLLISVIGGNKSFHVQHDVALHFQHGLLNAAKSTNGWIITSGQDEGVTKLVGDIIGRSILTSKIYTIGVASWGKTWNNEMLLKKNNRYNETVTDYSTTTPETGYASLEPNHSHFFLIDDGTTDNSGVEIKFRGELQYLITKMYEKDGVPLPMICIMLEGGSQSIEMALNSLRMGQPLVVIKGSGRAADIVCAACEMTTFKEEFVDGEFVMRGALSDDGKRTIQEMLELCFSKFRESAMVEKLMHDVLEIASLKKQVTIYKIDGSEPLDFAILSSLMKSIGESAARMRQLKLAITWGHEKVAKELIFEKKDYNFKPVELNSLLLFSIVNRRTGFIKLLLDYGADLKGFLTAPILTKLYNILPKNSGAYRILTHYDRAISLRDIGELMQIVMEGTYHSVLTQDRYNQDMREEDRFDNPYDLMAIYSALVDAAPMAKFFWENSRTPIATALIVHKIFLYLDRMEAKWARVDEEMTEKLEASARQFEQLSCGVMTICYHNYDKTDWVQILIVPMKEWGGLNLFDLATIIEAKNFIAHAAYQSYLTDLWMGQLKPSIGAGKLLFCMIPPLPILLSYNKVPMSKQDIAKKMLRGKEIQGRRKRVDDDVEFAPQFREDDDSDNSRLLAPKEKLYYFYTSPIIKFFLNTMTYLAFLCLYGYGLLVNDEALVINPEGSRLEWQDLYTIVFVLSTVPVEVNQIRNGRTKNHWKKIKDHFSDTYNLMDFIAVCMFMGAFGLKATTPYDKSDSDSLNLNNFGAYHCNRLLSAMCFSFYCFRFVQLFEINDQIGPKVFMLKKMSIDLFFFIFLLMVFTVSYGVSSQALLYPYRESSVFEVCIELFGRAYLNVFGEVDVDGLEEDLEAGHCYYNSTEDTFSHTNWNDSGLADPTDLDCSQANLVEYTTVGRINWYTVYGLLFLYLLFVNVMLINLLIAIFSNTYENVEQQSGIIYKTQRAEMILEFRERPPLPNPLSLIYFAAKMIRFSYRKYCKKINYEDDLQKMMSNMTNRHSSVAYRSSLMEAECRAQYIRKSKTEHGSQIITAISRQYLDLSNKIARLESHLGLANERIGEVSDMLSQRLKGKLKPSVDLWKGMVVHKLSQTSPYPGTEIERLVLTKDQVQWKHKMDEYKPPYFDNESIPHLDPTTPGEITFNQVDTAGVDRVSVAGRYSVVGGFPRNPKGRTGLGGRGNLPRWGPNKMSITIVSRYKELSTGHGKDASMPGGIINKNGQPVLEVLLLKMEGSTHHVFPQGFMAPNETTRHAHQRVLLDLCFDYNNISKTAQKPLLTSIDGAFKQYKEVARSYMDDSMNTDNAWIEIVVASVHDTDNNINQAFKKGRGVEEAEWVSVVEKPNLHSNMSVILKKTLTMLKAYNPYAAAEIDLTAVLSTAASSSHDH